MKSPIMQSEQDDRNQERNLSNLRKGFRELYDEIDQLSRNASLAAESAKSGREDSELLRKQDVDDLLVYARKFIREARSSIVTFDEHGVQCEAEKKSNKKVATPTSWMKPPETAPAVLKPEDNTRPKSVIQITHIVPHGCPRVASPQPPLNNKVSVMPSREVRNIGTNVNFVTQRAVKRTNLHGYVLPVSRPCSKKTQSARDERSQPAVKSTAPRTAPASIGRRPGQPLGGTFSDAQFKLLFDRFLLMQSKKKESGEHVSVEPTEEQLVERSENVQQNATPTEVESPTEVRDEIKRAMEDDVPSTKEAVDPIDSEDIKRNQNDENMEEEQPIDCSLLPKFTRHVLPSVSIQGRWDANLKVQQTGGIVILDLKDDARNSVVPNTNVKYVELRQGQ
uniref:Uncharacterized protein n=1 Tax=Anopheles atroparvus TaxID=41427 RepID=A0AAG5CZT6_ANOAO